MYAFSIVIPIYNSSTYIEKNLISNISRIDKNDRYEIILVDDCSADIEKIKQIINKYENIFVIEKEKKSNAADSRNIGFL
ncbi:MAG: glycosyltransferase, partial [Ignavibacteriae bacterium]|nr:glycosyltransferase [Ignavibacteriota bacterium]